MVYKDILIPKGTLAFVDLRGPVMDSDNFDNVLDYNPDRLTNDTLAAHLATSHFHPSGDGKRMCIGYRLAMAEMNVILHHILLQYSWRSAPSHTDELSFIPIRLPKDGHGVEVIRIEARNSVETCHFTCKIFYSLNSKTQLAFLNTPRLTTANSASSVKVGDMEGTSKRQI